MMQMIYKRSHSLVSFSVIDYTSSHGKMLFGTYLKTTEKPF